VSDHTRVKKYTDSLINGQVK